MKKIIIFITVMLLTASTALAGDVPEGLLSEDGAEVFFAEVLNYDKDADIAELKAVRVIKGDVAVGETDMYDEIAAVGIEPEVGEVYLAAYYDEINPTYLFETTSTNTAKLKLKNTNNAGMWKRFEDYLNNGDYEEAEMKRRDKLNEQNSVAEEITLAVFLETDRNNAEKVYLRDAEARVEVDKDKFFNLAEKMVLVKTKNVTPADRNGIYIEIDNKDQSKSFGYISAKGEADQCSLMMSRLPASVYTVKMSAFSALSELFSASERGIVSYWWILPLAAVFVLAVAIFRRKR